MYFVCLSSTSSFVNVFVMVLVLCDYSLYSDAGGLT